MSNSNRDRRGKRINGEIWGRGAFRIVGDRLIALGGGEGVGTPIRKKDAKREVVRMRRRYNKKVILNAVQEVRA